MTAVFEAKFAQAVKTAGCPDDFSKWLISQKLTDYESFGVTAPNEEKLATEITTVAESNGVKFATIGDKGCVAKLWRASRSAIDAGPTPGIPRVASDPAGLSEGTDQTIKDLWMKRHNLALSDSVLLVRPLLARLHRELTAASPFLGVYPMEQLRSMACLETSKATLLQIEPGKAVEGVEVAADTISGHWQIYTRIRAFFHTCAYVSISDTDMFDFQTAHFATEKVLTFLQLTYNGRTPPVQFFVLAWAQTCHICSEHMRTRENAKLKTIVREGALWESHWVSFIPAQSGSGGSAMVSDTPQEILAETRAAKRVAAMARSTWDNYSATSPNVRAWNNQGTGGKPFGGKGGSWIADGKGTKKKRRRGGKGNK